ncbi:nitrite and sulfite reductase 4Fe-4S subunit [Alicycliphilus sp. B1]|nr:nitrite and sulfite reductase 4Fe-4S subunit [Alicycliphilus sp. B1]
MYQYTDFDRQFVKLRAQQFRDQLERWQRGELTDEQLLPLRLQNGWYIQRYAPMARIAVPYGEISSLQLRTLGRIAREYDKPDPELLARAQATQDQLEASQPGQTLPAPPLKYGYGHFTTRTNCQFNWIPITKAADVMDLLASVCMHGIQTSGNDIRNITCDAWEGIAEDGIVDCRPFAEITRQWSSLHPEFSYLPRKFKIAFNGAAEDRAAIGWYDIGLQALRNDAGEVGFTVKVGGGMGRTPIVGSVVREFLPWDQLLNYIEAIVRVYNGYGRRDNKWKARIKILVKSEGQAFIDAVEKEYQRHRRPGRRPSHHHPGRTRPRDEPLRGARAQERRPASQGGPAGPALPALAAPERARPPPAGHEDRDPVVQAPGLRPRRRRRRHAGRPGPAGRAVQRVRGAPDPRAEPDAALGVRVRPARAVRGRAQAGPGAAQHRPADRHDLLPGRGLLLAGQRALAAHRRRP